jgi:hypothetical protein
MIAYSQACYHNNLQVAQCLYDLGGIDIHANREKIFQETCWKDHLETTQWLYSLGGVNIHFDDEFAFRGAWKWLNGYIVEMMIISNLGIVVLSIFIP